MSSNKIDFNKLPRHVAIIMDGNRRWAASKSKSKLYGHEQGVKRLSKVVDYSIAREIGYLTLYAFSSENWQRSEVEIKNLKLLMGKFLDEYSDDILAKNIRFRSIGNIDDFGEVIALKVLELEKQSEGNTGLNLTVALSYGARDEIVRAVNNILLSKQDLVSTADFQKYLYTSDLPDPDLLIRTGGEIRLSNFLLWQAAYSELYFTDVFWPDFDDAEYNKALEFFATRQRRYGAS